MQRVCVCVCVCVCVWVETIMNVTGHLSGSCCYYTYLYSITTAQEFHAAAAGIMQFGVQTITFYKLQ
jgi:hypothetical protein